MKKILILTLGAGSVLGEKETNSNAEAEKERIQKMVKQGSYPYKKTDYVVEITGNKNEGALSSEFVAEIQIKQYQPDMIIIIGTVKSCWSMFYRKFTQNSKIDEKTMLSEILRLHQMEQSYGKDTDNETLGNLEREIQQIYDGKLTFSEEKAPDIKVCLIRYGMNNEELLENYRRISNIEKYLDEKEKYDVAFDITHSFRSLPIYNLVILNYLQQVSPYNMKLSHIFYGNFDAKRENNNKAPLVDLADMIEILNLTNAVSEFKNTGNAGSLIQIFPKNEDKLKSALESFDWATQINGRDEVINAVRKLSNVLNEEIKERNRYVDVKNMLKRALGEGADNLLQIVSCENKGKVQLLLAMWYQSQNRYGLAVATAMEALRSFLVPYYLNNSRRNETDCENESNRKAAIQRLDRVVKSRDNSLESDIPDFLVELDKKKNAIKPIRDMFAHNLQEVDPDNVQQAKKEIDTFIDKLKQLGEYLERHENEFEKIYCYEPKKRKIEKKTGAGIRVFISDSDDEEEHEEQYEKIKKSRQGKCTVYKVPVQVVGRKKKMDRKEILKSGCRLCEYLNRYFEKEKVCVVFDKEMELRKRMNYAMILYHNEFSNVYYIEDDQMTKGDQITNVLKLVNVPKLVFDISYEMPEYFNDEVMEEEPMEIK